MSESNTHIEQLSLFPVSADEKTRTVAVAVPLAQIRQHANTIRDLLLKVDENEEPDTTLHIYRALYEVEGRAVSAKIERAKNPGKPGIPLLNVQVQRRFSADGALSAQAISSDIGLQAEEMAVFLGLDAVDPASVQWVEQILQAHIGASEIKESKA